MSTSCRAVANGFGPHPLSYQAASHGRCGGLANALTGARLGDGG
jgi:hypothetical protein